MARVNSAVGKLVAGIGEGHGSNTSVNSPCAKNSNAHKQAKTALFDPAKRSVQTHDCLVGNRSKVEFENSIVHGVAASANRRFEYQSTHSGRNSLNCGTQGSQARAILGALKIDT
ncbi:hypothetical protein RLO149_c008830 [Roseobacter litoralis Och 149]|uniref:Uncharacterized protein n=1 Tax=Roseobacter litoralis (strain ATCC 49566 / DSM 6996 / JCM 21268 / NBRC 15278 / OCh 149) TaxID=391595 RepID=F7Z9U9_ROSLO|nr:hypothetical protein RLO149_c008830 [Roseobacter litoralis Och 149]